MRLVITAVCAVLLATPRPADACGGYVAHNEGLRLNDALELVVVRDGTRTVMSVRNRYRGPVEHFALLVPVPQVLQPGDVVTLDPSVFDQIAALTAPQLYHLREDDPCRPPPKGEGAAGAPGAGRGLGVTVESSFQVGEYDVVTLSATDAAGLDAWLQANDYKVPDAMAPLLRPYVDAGSKFFVAKVDPARVTFDATGVATLSPLRFSYESDEVSIPLRLSTANSPGVQDVLIHAIATSRLDAANRPVATIPTNVAMSPEAKGGFDVFYEALFREVLVKTPGAVVTEYAMQMWPYWGREVLTALGANTATDADIDKLVVTRLHLRLDKASTHDDLVLRAAGAIRGGRRYTGHDAVPGDKNDFRAEYEVRHPWTGPVKCDRPRWGNWEPDGNAMPGGPAFGPSRPETTPPLAAVVAENVPSLGVTARYQPPYHPRPKRSDGYGSGCGCGSTDEPAFALVALVLLAIGSRRGPLRVARARARRV